MNIFELLMTGMAVFLIACGIYCKAKLDSQRSKLMSVLFIGFGAMFLLYVVVGWLWQ